MNPKKEKTELTDDDKQFILDNYDKLTLSELCQKITGDPNVTGLNKIGWSIREFLATKDKKAMTTKVVKKGEYILTDEQREFVESNIDKMKPPEMINLLFPNEKKSLLSAEARAIYKFIKQIKPESIAQNEEIVEEIEFDIPKSIARLIPLVNRYVPHPRNENEKLFNPQSITNADEKMLRALLGYIQVPRFQYQANQYKMAIDRALFVSTFIRYLWDKPETPQEEVDQFISLAAEVVTTSQIDRNIQRLEAEMEEEYQTNKRVSQGIVDYINAARDKLDKSKERQKKLYDALVGSRAKRLGDKLQNNASILNLVDAWRDEKKRLQMIELAQKQKAAEQQDLDSLANMDAVVALIAGVSKDDFLR